MAAPAPQAPPVSPDTLVTIKVLYNDTNRRFKIPLRDLGARVFPQKLRQLLGVPADADVSFERYSDSATSYVLLDSENPAVYKQLYRAAKAKLKLRIKATTITQPMAMPEVGPTPVAQELPVQKEPSPRYSYLDTVLSSPLPPPTRTDTLSTLVSTTLDPLEAIRATANNVEEDCPANAPVDRPRYRLFTLGKDRPTYPLLFPSADSPATAAFCIDCNNCGRSIPGEHYHCSICDDGDYDLCPACVDAGVTCHGEDHWLIRRLVNNGVVINSTTETIAPRRPKVEPEGPKEKAAEPEPEPEPEPAPAPIPEPVSAVPNPAEEVDERTCNACFREFDETKMVTCSDCEDYDLCITCLLKDAHGHHPAHSFSLIRDRQFCLKNLVLSRCRPGRHQHHAAICDGCDQRIVGVRHKCLACPDWDFCWSCIKTAPETHPGHRFVPLYEAIADPTLHHEIHYGIFCDGPLCRNKPAPGYITGVRYKCAVCHDTDFCAACEALPTNHHNRTHPLIKFKTPVRNVSVSTFGDDGIGGPTISMGDRQTTVIPPPTASSSSNGTIVVDEKRADEQPLEQKTVEEERVMDQEVQSEEPQMELPVDNEQTKSTVMAASAAGSEFQAFFMRDTVRDGTKLPPNHVFQQTWTLYNPGPLAWPAGSSVRFVGGDSMFNIDTAHPSSVGSLRSAMESSELSAPLAPGESADFTVTLRTPQREGTSISYWRLKLPDGTPFGHKLWCDVQVTTALEEEVVPNEVTKEMSQETAEVQEEPKEEPKLSESNMIFPKLEKESPVSSTHEAMTEAPVASSDAAPSAPSLSNADEQDVLEDVESLALEDVDTDDVGYLTDEEYDILDASDEDFSQAKQG